MSQSRKNKRAETRPDEYFAAGPLEFARFGNLVMARSRANPEQWKDMTAEMAADLPRIVAEIDALTAGIAYRVSRLPPDKLLQRAWWELAGILTGANGRETDEFEQLTAMRMVDYVQSVIASVNPAVSYAVEVTEDDWTKLKEDVGNLFSHLSLNYQMSVTAYKQTQDANLHMELEEFRVRAEILWMNVRGKRFQSHEKQALLDVLTPHSDVLIRLFGIDASTLVAELDKILAKLTRGLRDLSMDLERLQEFTYKRLSEIAYESGETELVKLREKLFQDLEFVARRDKVVGELTGLDLFDVEKNTNLPKALRDDLAWSPGEDTEFFSPGEFCGWPLRVWPTMRRPFIRLNDRVYCFDMFALFDTFYRVLQRLISRLAPDYRETWNTRQKDVAEALPLAYLTQLLPGAEVFQPVYYRWTVGGGPAQWYEADGLAIYDDHLFVIEVKAGAFTYTAPAIDLPAHIDSLLNLALSPASQGSRFVDFLESASEVVIADAQHREVRKLRRSDFRHVTVCAVTLDPFTDLAARVQHLRNTGIDVGQRPVWVLSIDCLRVYADLFDNPLTFLHYTEQRMRAAGSTHVDLIDEMDHFGLYVVENNHRLYAEELVGSEPTKLTLDGYRTLVDEYYNKVARGEKPDPPKQKMPKRIAEIIDKLAVSTIPGRSAIASFLLDAAGDQREIIADSIDQQLRGIAALGRPRPVSTYGDHAFTLWAWSPPVPRNPAVVIDHARAVVSAGNEQRRLVLELEYSATGQLTDTLWQYVNLDGLSDTELSRAHDAGTALRRERVAAVRSQRKIGANETCPCGSGRKYKRC